MNEEKDAFEENLERVLTFLQTYWEQHHIPPSARLHNTATSPKAV